MGVRLEAEGGKSARVTHAPRSAHQRTEAEREMRSLMQSEGEQRVLRWWRAVNGALPNRELIDEDGRPVDPLCVLAYRAGRIGALRLLDTHDAAQRSRFLSSFYSGPEYGDRGMPGQTRWRALNVPSARRIALAVRLLNAVDAALEGDDDRVWSQIERAVAASRQIDARYVALEQLSVILRGSEYPRAVVHALRVLRRLHPKLAKLSVDEVHAALEDVNVDVVSEPLTGGPGKRSTFFALARIAVDHEMGRDDGSSSIWYGALILPSDRENPARGRTRRDAAIERFAERIREAWSQGWKSAARGGRPRRKRSASKPA